MAWIRLVNGENKEHVLVVLLKVTALAAVVPGSRRRADGIHAARTRIERRSVVEIGDAVAALELRHFQHLTAVRLRQAQDVLLLDERLDLLDRRANVLDKQLLLACLTVVVFEDAL